MWNKMETCRKPGFDIGVYKHRPNARVVAPVVRLFRPIAGGGQLEPGLGAGDGGGGGGG